MKLVAIVGTNSKKSYNRQLLQYMQKHFSNQVDIELREIKDIPLFNEDALDIPKSVTDLTRAVRQADGGHSWHS